MDEDKKRKLEEKLRQLMMNVDFTKDEAPSPVEKRPSVVRIIRRRKGAPDLQIA